MESHIVNDYYALSRAPENKFKPLVCQQKTILTCITAAGSERGDEMKEEEQENAVHLKTASAFAGNQEETKSKSCPSDQVYTASQSPNQPKNFKLPGKTFGSKKLTKRFYQPAWFEQ